MSIASDPALPGGEGKGVAAGWWPEVLGGEPSRPRSPQLSSHITSLALKPEELHSPQMTKEFLEVGSIVFQRSEGTTGSF